MYGSAAGTGATMAKPQPPKEEKKADPQIASKEKKQAMLKKQVLMKKLQAVRAGAGSDITSSYEPDSKLTEGEDKVETPAGMGDITFDAGGAIPTTIKAIGDPRELETAMKLKKTQLRASGLNMSHEPEGDMVEAKVDKGMIFGKDAARNERRFGTKGKFDPQGSGPRGQDISQRAKLAVQRKKEHEARRGVKTKGMIKESEKLAQGASDRARKLGAMRRKKQGSNRGMYKSERAGYNLSQSQRSQNASLETQRGPQTGGGPKPFGFARNKSNPIKSKTFAGSGNKAKKRMDAMKSEAYVVNQADKTSNTPAYQGYKEGKKNKLTGEPLYKKGNMKENLVTIEKINVKPSFYNDEKNAINEILKKNFNLGEEGYDIARDRGMVRPSKIRKMELHIHQVQK